MQRTQQSVVEHFISTIIHCFLWLMKPPMHCNELPLMEFFEAALDIIMATALRHL